MRIDGLRWVAYMVFVVSSILNYLDRQLIAALAPLIMAEMHLTQAAFGLLISVFSVAYAASSLAAGWFIDRAGVNRAISTAVAWWSLAGLCTSVAKSFAGLAACRTALGIGESAGVPAVGKVNAMYLKPAERALGTAANQIGLSLGAASAALWVGVAIAYGWRMPFLITGLCGLLWIPLWLAVSRAIPPSEPPARPPQRRSEWTILGSRPLILLVVANVLWMGAYALWSSWTTLYLTHVHHVSLLQSVSYIWIPPLVSNAGGFFGGWLSWRSIRGGANPVTARRRAVWVSAAGALVTLALPFAPDAGWATALISASFFFVLAGSVNIYALPIDIFGAARSGLAISALTCAFGVLQTAISPVIGYLSDHRLYTQVIWLVTAPLIASALVLMGIKEESFRSDRPPA